MPVSVEARAIQVSDRLSDLVLCAAHVHEELDSLEFQAFIARTLEIPSTSIVTAADIAEARRFLEPSTPWTWDGEAASLAERCVQAIVLGNFGPSAKPEWPFPPFMEPFHFEQFYRRRRRWPRHARFQLALDAATRLDWAPLGGEEPDAELVADLDLVFEHELGIGQSPPVKPFSIRELVRSTRTIVLVPTAAGSLGAATAMATGNWTAAILSAAIGPGASVAIAGGLWLADKLMAGVKHLEAAPRRRELPPGRARRKPRDAGPGDTGDSA